MDLVILWAMNNDSHSISAYTGRKKCGYLIVERL